MANTSLGAVLRHLRQIAAPDQRSDRELLHAFAAERDEASFAALVRRHGALVLQVGRRVLHHEQDAEDVFQATFLVLAAKAASIRKTGALASFLHGVAYRLALRAKRDAARRRAHEAQAPTPAIATDDPSWREVQAILEDEVERLPERLRAPFILCYLQGLSRVEAARRLEIPEGTVWSRLSQTRARLQKQLARRGIDLAAVLGAAAVSGGAQAIAPKLLEMTVRSAQMISGTGWPAAAISMRVALLLQAGMRIPAPGTVKLVLAALVASMMLTSAIGIVSHVATWQPQEFVAAAPQPGANAGEKAQPPKPQPARMDHYGDPLPEGAIARLGTLRLRPSQNSDLLASLPDGKTFLSGPLLAGGSAVNVWDLATGKLLRRSRNLSEFGGWSALSPNGRLLALARAQPTARLALWDVNQDQVVRTFDLPQAIAALSFAPDNKLLATADDEGEQVRFWDTTTGAMVRSFKMGRTVWHGLAFSPDGKMLAQSQGTEIHIWDPDTGRKLRVIRDIASRPAAMLLFSPDGKTLASRGIMQSCIQLWDPATGRELRRLEADMGVQNAGYMPLAFSPDSRTLASGDGFDRRSSPDRCLIRLWEVATGRERRQFDAHPFMVSALAFSLDGQSLISGGKGDSIRIWDVTTGQERLPFAAHEGAVQFISFSPDGQTLATGGEGGALRLWDAVAGKHMRVFDRQRGQISITFAPDGRALLAGGSKEIRYLDPATGAKLRTMQLEGLVYSFARDGRTAASLKEEPPHNELSLWDLNTGRRVRQIDVGNGFPMSPLFLPDGNILLNVLTAPYFKPGSTSIIRLLEPTTGKDLRRLEVPGRSLAALTVHGHLLAGAANWRGENISTPRHLHLWDLLTTKERTYELPQNLRTLGAASSPDGRLLALADMNGYVHLWDVSSGRILRRLTGHQPAGVMTLTFSPDGMLLASGSWDTTVLLWDVRRLLGPRTESPLAAEQLPTLWDDLASADPAQAHHALGRLGRSPREAVPFLAERLRPAQTADAQRLKSLLADLHQADFARRDAAMRELEKLDDQAQAALRESLAKKQSSLELRRRIERILEKLDGPPTAPATWRDLRAVSVLETINTPEAPTVLERLSQGAPFARLTREAKASLERLAQRATSR